MGAILLALLLSGPALTDDRDQQSLLRALENQERHLESKVGMRYRLGDRSVTGQQLLATTREFREVVRDYWGTPRFQQEITRRFDILPGVSTYFTGYYLPLLDARRHKTGQFVYPLYALPVSGRGYSRQQIEAGALAGKGLEIAWVNDPIKRYSLMVQGSGMLRFEDGRVVNVNYAGSNGHPYRSLGKLFMQWGLLSEETLSWQRIRDYLTANPEKREPIFNHNPSYVYFKIQGGGPYGVLQGVPLTPGRSIATDKRVYPGGGLAYIEFPEPIVGKDGKLEGFRQTGRFVLDQDTGGAIRGPARCDIFMGGGDEAAEMAGYLKHYGQMRYLVKK